MPFNNIYMYVFLLITKKKKDRRVVKCKIVKNIIATNCVIYTVFYVKRNKDYMYNILLRKD